MSVFTFAIAMAKENRPLENPQKKQPYERNENQKSENSTNRKIPGGEGGGGGLSELEANMATFDVSNWF